MNYYSVIVGEVGAGKSSFINAVLKHGKSSQKLCDTGSSYTSVTKNIDPKYIEKDLNKFYLIDTPGLNDGDGAERNINALRKEVSGNPENLSRINSILIVMKVTDYRLTSSLINCIEEFMNCFPVSNFWEHVIVIRTHAKTLDEINKVKGNFLLCLKNNKKIKSMMDKKNIKMINRDIEEFYVNSVLENNRINENMGEIDEILRKIKKTDPLYEKVEYSGKMSKNLGNMKVIYQIMRYKDFNSGEWKECEKIIDCEGDEKTVVERVGNSYTKSCRKGRFQQYQKYVIEYDKRGEFKNKYKFGPQYEDLA